MLDRMHHSSRTNAVRRFPVSVALLTLHPGNMQHPGADQLSVGVCLVLVE